MMQDRTSNSSSIKIIPQKKRRTEWNLDLSEDPKEKVKKQSESNTAERLIENEYSKHKTNQMEVSNFEAPRNNRNFKKGTKRKIETNAAIIINNCQLPKARKTDSTGKRKIIQPRTIRTRILKEKVQSEGYLLGKRLGSGAYSTVKVATFNDVKMACKIVDKSKCSKIFVTKFLPREIEIFSRVSHPNIVKLYKTMQVDDFVLFFLEYCERDLSDLISKDGRLQENDARYYFKQILSALQYLNRLGIAHRDVKAENVLLTSDNIVKLSDFGLSRTSDGTLTNTFCGSLEFAPPEIHTQTDYNPMFVDVWALGCLLFTMLTAHLPFTHKQETQFLDNVMHCKLNNSGKGTISPGAMRVIKKLLVPDAQKRINIQEVSSLPWVKGKCHR